MFRKIDYGDKDYTYGYYKKHKLSNGQVCQIYFLWDYEECSKTIYQISFVVANNFEEIKYGWDTYGESNNLFYKKQTGKCGLEALIWAKKQIIKFENFIKTKPNTMLVCKWANDKRKNAYVYGLSKIGFEYDKEKDYLYKVLNT